MKYDLTIHNPSSIRLKVYGYTRAGAYFITLGCQERKKRFGKMEMILNEFGTIVLGRPHYR